LSDLHAFFTHAGAFLVRGEGTAESVEAALGPSPSGTARLALYARLVERQQREALEALFPATRRALEHLVPRAFAELCLRFACTHRSAIAHPGGLGAPFVAFLADPTNVAWIEERTANDAAWLAELADFERVRYELATSDAPFPTGADPLVVTRRYAHAVHRANDDSPVPRPEAVSLLLVRVRDTLRVRWLEVGAAELVIVGVVTGQLDRDAGGRLGLSEEMLAAARERLRRVGWLRDAPDDVA
jgi:hypothetical protein